MNDTAPEPLLKVTDLNTNFNLAGGGTVEAVRGVGFEVYPGETVAIVGESGSGKSVSAFSVMQLLDRNAYHPSGKILFKGENILEMDVDAQRDLRGDQISIIFQEPGTSLNPVFTVGGQVAEVLRVHKGMSKADAKTEVVSLFNKVGIPLPEQRYDAYPHELSGGMKQRVMIAMAIACKPDLLIADEPTTALDVTIQAQILRLIRDIQREMNMAVLIITHDLGVVNEVADRVLVMNDGEILERGDRMQIYKDPQHDYTKKLLAAVPSKLQRVEKDLPDETLLDIRELRTWFPVRSGILQRVHSHIKAVDGVSMKITRGETLALVGESGSGKTTVGKSIARLVEPHSGEINYMGMDLLKMSPGEMQPWRKHIQVIFQDPANSLDPRMVIKDIVGEGIRSFMLAKSKKEMIDRVADLLKRVGLQEDILYRYPHEFSGGQRQRICIARALAVDPQFVICDEATSALDVSVQAEVLDLLRELQKDLGLTYLFITHDLSVVESLADRVAVMYGGKLVEEGDTDDIFTNPQQEYTRNLLESAPSMDPDRRSL